MWRRWVTFQDFFLTFIDELEKRLFININCWKGPIKKKKNFNIYNVIFFKKIKKKTWRYHYFTPVYQNSWWYDLQLLRYGTWRTEIGSNPLKTWKIRILKKSKKIAGDFIILYMCIVCMVPEIWSTNKRHLCHFGPFFALLHH